jgi:hypothetical protein
MSVVLRLTLRVLSRCTRTSLPASSPIAGDGSAAIVLVEHGVQKAKELQVIGQFSWLHM